MTWTNWTGDQRCDPAGRAVPRSPEELAEIVGAATAEGTAVKVVGSGHSFTEAALGSAPASRARKTWARWPTTTWPRWPRPRRICARRRRI